jgi:hypothetical protein
MTSRRGAAIGIVSAAFAWSAALAHAEDFFLTIGGGYDPSGNQASLERNVLFQQRVLRDRAPGATLETYFADGDAPARELQVLDHAAKEDCPPARRLMAEIFGDADAVGICYRNHEVDDVAGPTELGLLKRRFRELGEQLKAGDRLIIYATGHGSEAMGSYEEYAGFDFESGDQEESWFEHDAYGAEEEPPAAEAYNTSLALWDNEAVEAREFARWLDRLPKDVRVVLIMVQCFGGGFAHTIFHQNDAALGLSDRPRCGFFAQVHDRPAAGCTPDSEKPDFLEYSTCFWTALGGKTARGESIESPDYDRDGRVSFAEAHAYTVITCESIDIPVRTSEELLRQYSRLGEAAAEDDGEGAESGIGRLLGMLAKTPAEQPELAEAAGSLAAVMQLATPEQRVILEQLPKKLELNAGTVEAIREDLDAATAAEEQAMARLTEAGEKYQSTMVELRGDVTQQWPELNATYAPLAAELTGADADKFVAFVEDLASFRAHRTAADQLEQASDGYMDAKNREAALQRLVRTMKPSSSRRTSSARRRARSLTVTRSSSRLRTRGSKPRRPTTQSTPKATAPTLRRMTRASDAVSAISVDVRRLPRQSVGVILSARQHTS